MVVDMMRWKLKVAAGYALRRGWDAVRSAAALHPEAPESKQFASFGHGSLIGFPQSTLYGHSSIHIGTGVLVASWATLAAGYYPEQPDVPQRCLVIGDRCVIGIRSGIIAHESVELGNDVWLGQHVFITDANHGYGDPEAPIGQQLGDHKPVRIGDGSWLGHGSVVLPGVTIGKHVVVAAGSVVTKDVDDYAIVAGVPAGVIEMQQ